MCTLKQIYIMDLKKRTKYLLDLILILWYLLNVFHEFVVMICQNKNLFIRF